MQPVHERLRQARLARREDLASVAERIGVRLALLLAIEAGQYEALPHGLYGRAAIRSFAEDLGFDGQAILAQCERLLAPFEDPIAGLARVRGIRPAADSTPRQLSRLLEVRTAALTSGPLGRMLAAAAIDSAIVTGLLLALVAATITLFGTPVLSAEAGPAFGVVGIVLATCYFAVFGGIGGQTVGARLVHVEAAERSETPVDLAGIAVRAFRAAARDIIAVEQLAGVVRAFSASCRSSASRRDRQRAEQPARS